MVQCSFHSRGLAGTPWGSVLITDSGCHQQMAHLSLKIKSNTLSAAWKTVSKCAAAALLNTTGCNLASTAISIPWSQQQAHHVWQWATPLTPRSHQHHHHIPTTELRQVRHTQTGPYRKCYNFPVNSIKDLKHWQDIWGISAATLLNTSI